MQWLAPEETTLDEAELTNEERRYQEFLDKIVHSNQGFIPIGKHCQEGGEYEDDEDDEEDEEGEEEEDDSNEEEDEVEADAEPNDVPMEEEPPDPNFSVNTLIQN